MSDSEPEHVEVWSGPPSPVSPAVTPPNTSRSKEGVGILTEHHEGEYEDEDEATLSRVGSGEQVDLTGSYNDKSDKLIETRIEWNQGGHQVYVTGSFTGWKQMIPLNLVNENVFGVVLRLSPGIHRLRFVVDGELRCSDEMSTATDSMGNLVNYMQVDAPNENEYTQWEDETPVEQAAQYTREIPEIFVNPEALDKLASNEFTTPPQLPPHLDGVILNTNWSDKDNNSVLPVPNHVVLNHLATTSIRHNVLAVASVSRFQDKFVTQILYTPL